GVPAILVDFAKHFAADHHPGTARSIALELNKPAIAIAATQIGPVWRQDVSVQINLQETGGHFRDCVKETRLWQEQTRGGKRRTSSVADSRGLRRLFGKAHHLLRPGALPQAFGGAEPGRIGG